MAIPDSTITFSVGKTPNEAFNAINNVRGWWTEDMEGYSQKLNDEFTVRFFDDIHVTRQKIVEMVQDTKVVWLVTSSQLNFLKDKSEWTGTKICFEVTERDKKTHIRFTHVGLVAGIECYNDCSRGWNHYIKESLLKLITDGKGIPERKSIKNLVQ